MHSQSLPSMSVSLIIVVSPQPGRATDGSVSSKVTDAQRDAQRAANAEGEHGAITDAEIAAILVAASPAETLKTLMGVDMGLLKDGKLGLAAALVNNRDAKWSKAYEAGLEKMLLKGDVGKPLLEFIRPALNRLQATLYTSANIKTLATVEMQDTVKTLASRFDAVIADINLRAAYKYVDKLGVSGAQAIHAQLQAWDDSSDDTKLYNATTSKLAKEKGNAAYLKGGEKFAAAVKKAHPGVQHQPFTTLLEVLVFSAADEESFKSAVLQIGAATGAEVKLSERKGSSLKGFLRLYEKALLKAVILGLDHVDFSLVYDVLRAMLVAPTTEVAVKAQAAVYGGKQLPPCRSKCRLVGESVTGWRDELVNVKHATGKHGLIGEIQIVRSKMLLQRETMGGLRGLHDACVARGHGSRQLAKKEQKALDKLLAKSKKITEKKNKAIAAWDAELAKLALQVEAITGAKPAGAI
eukprot:gene1817-14258_t